MQRLVPFVVALALVLSGTHLPRACSSFAVYGKNGPFSGMNVDMPTRAEAAESAGGFFEHQHNRLALNRRSDVAVFRYDYIFFYTDRGVFGCTQYAQPTFTMNPSDKKPVDWSHAQVSAIDFERAADVVVFLEERRLWADGEADFHWLLADTQGNAFIIEPGADDNHILPGEGGFTVMTNFFHHYLEDGFAQKFAENYPGADLLDLLDHDGRYRRGAALIRSSLDHFDHLKGLEVLKAMSSPITKVSVVIDAGEQKAYLALFRDFSRIWEVDLEAGTIATHMGFAQERCEELRNYTVPRLAMWE